MRISQTAAVLAACCASAHAFSDSSPIVMFSSASLDVPTNQELIKSNTNVLATVQQLLKTCPTDRYLIVSQPNLNKANLVKKAVPNLLRYHDKAQSRYSVPEVVGELHTDDIAAFVRKSCEGRKPLIEQLEMDPLRSDDDFGMMWTNDDELSMVLDQFDHDGSYTVIFAGTPRKESPRTYTATFQDGVPSELKRDVHSIHRRAPNRTDNRPLFEKYQYFSTGIFTALVSLTILLSILYVGIAAVASLEIPYGAFDKEMGPSAQKKQ
ncbi:BIG1-domain-containing protein [Daldinia caldariorum]|uniref:BIG1-domain-containing protein n=1 Tax=Daldinia caldariorum TaxID=326644 RepID=UPI0020083D5E|nr:BIG1-domain-containing protein [Daldinia caldariorum]KAI1468471.1 BIG1-domain-containing protein [Daldinia caldariorum]